MWNFTEKNMWIFTEKNVEFHRKMLNFMIRPTLSAMDSNTRRQFQRAMPLHSLADSSSFSVALLPTFLPSP